MKFQASDNLKSLQFYYPYLSLASAMLSVSNPNETPWTASAADTTRQPHAFRNLIWCPSLSIPPKRNDRFLLDISRRPESFTFGYPQEIQDFMEAIATGRGPKSGVRIASDTVAVPYADYLLGRAQGCGGCGAAGS
jgi:hypothetical protein